MRVQLRHPLARFAASNSCPSALAFPKNELNEPGVLEAESKKLTMKDPGEEKRWQVLYKKAVLEPDPMKSTIRIAQAQRAIQERARELWYSGSPAFGERRELHAALHFLRLLLTLGGRNKNKVVENFG